MKRAIYGKEARKGLKEGLDIVANAVKVTMGALGLPVAIDIPYHTPIVTKDGVSVAESIDDLEDPLLNMGAKMITSAASKTNEMAGDGTSTCSVLTQAIVEGGMKALDKGNKFYELKKGMEFAADKIIENLKKDSISIKDDFSKMKSVATISANNDEKLGDLIAETFKSVGEYGFISVEDAHNSKTTVEISTGLKFKMSPESQYMFQDTIKRTSEIKNSKVLLYIGRIDKEEEILPALELTGDKQHLLIVCNEISPLLLTRLVSTKLQGKINVTVIQAPEYGQYRDEAMEDIALMCGAKLFLQEKDDNPADITLEDLGNIEKLSIDDTYTSFISAATKEKVEQKAQLLAERLEETEDPLEMDALKQRIARLKGGVARIYVGAASEMEAKEKKDRIVDAVNALTVAYKDGVVLGGGLALVNASRSIQWGEERSKSFMEGVSLVMKAVKSPINQILKNADHKNTSRKEIIANVKGNKGYDVLRDEYVDMEKNGILDPLMVTVYALQNAISVSGVFLSTECVLIDETNTKSKYRDVKFADGI